MSDDLIGCYKDTTARKVNANISGYVSTHGTLQKHSPEVVSKVYIFTFFR